MSNPAKSPSTTLPAYLSSATPNPKGNRAPWYKNTAPTYAGIFLWFVFWQQAVATKDSSLGGSLSQGIGVALLGVVIAVAELQAALELIGGLCAGVEHGAASSVTPK